LGSSKWRRVLRLVAGRTGLRGLIVLGLGVAVVVMFVHIVLSIAVLALVGVAWIMLAGKAVPSRVTTVRFNPRHPVVGAVIRARRKLWSLIGK
jgi:membrane protein CcdC involved in cytochrome C biogenesis